MTGLNQNELWAITCYFNPVGYRTRLENYHIFRKNLRVPLITVELSFDGTFHLNEGDAEQLIQIREGGVMWQKERLLNIALQKLPVDCNYVMWLDCDLVFDRQDLSEAVVAALRDNVLIQPYSIVCDLEKDAKPTDVLDENYYFKRESMAWQISKGTMVENNAKTDMKNHYSPGHAWAVQRKAIEETSFYDAMILGSADLAMGMAAIGRSERIVTAFSMNESQAKHYQDWSKQWEQTINGRIGVVEGIVRHLWHGDLENRGYTTRYDTLGNFNFDPYKDIALNTEGCWDWSSDKPEMHAFAREYFESRKEDGD